jgi:glucose-1-phosphate cytidylyltransferase
MKIVILAGGLGTRLSEETKLIPKPMVKIGNRPILWHIIKFYRSFGFKEFIIASGYKSKIIENYFKKKVLDTNIKVVNTGKYSLTGHRIYRLKKILENGPFMLTYGDGLSNINIQKLIRHHKRNKKLATISIVRPPARWGSVKLNKDNVKSFEEKNHKNEGWVNGGFMIIEPQVFNYFNNKVNCVLERDVFNFLIKDKNLSAFKHNDFWQCMDTLREKTVLNKMWKMNKAPWKIWKD